jgi:hypothetical protein
MRILFLAPHPFFAERGTPIAVRLAVEALCKAGHEVDLLTYHEGQDIAVPGMRLIRIAATAGSTERADRLFVQEAVVRPVAGGRGAAAAAAGRL